MSLQKKTGGNDGTTVCSASLVKWTEVVFNFLRLTNCFNCDVK